jgi:hypothetical protein
MCELVVGETDRRKGYAYIALLNSAISRDIWHHSLRLQQEVDTKFIGPCRENNSPPYRCATMEIHFSKEHTSGFIGSLAK